MDTPTMIQELTSYIGTDQTLLDIKRAVLVILQNGYQSDQEAINAGIASVQKQLDDANVKIATLTQLLQDNNIAISE